MSEETKVMDLLRAKAREFAEGGGEYGKVIPRQKLATGGFTGGINPSEATASWVYAADLVEVIGAGRFWALMDDLVHRQRAEKRLLSGGGEKLPGRLIGEGERLAYRLHPTLFKREFEKAAA